MLNGKRIVAVIPARAGSKRLPNKNMRIFAGRPLIDWTIHVAQVCGVIDQIIVSSDDESILEEAKKMGLEVPFRRPLELSTDEASGTEVIIHALQYAADADYVVCLQPTSPLRTSQDIRGLLEIQFHENADTMMSVCHFPKPLQWLYPIDSDNRLHETVMPKDASMVLPNGAIYSAKKEYLLENRTFYSPSNTKGYLMPYIRSIDIDTLDDWKMAEALFPLFRNLEIDG